MKKTILILFVAIVTISCTTVGGGNWWLVDFDKESRNYRDLGDYTTQITVGMSESQRMERLGKFIHIVEATQEYKTLGIDQWETAVGNDYIIRVLYIKIVDNSVDRFLMKDISNQRTVIPIFIWN